LPKGLLTYRSATQQKLHSSTKGRPITLFLILQPAIKWDVIVVEQRDRRQAAAKAMEAAAPIAVTE